jgi:PKD repeat protein
VRTRFVLVIAVMLASLPLIPAPAARAEHSMPPLDPSKIEYAPIGYYGPPDEAGTPEGESAQVPLTPTGGPPMLNNPNPSGKWIAYDTNVWEALTLPYRHPGDNCNSIPAAERHAHCLSGDMDDDSSDPVARTGYTGYSGPTGTSAIHGTCPPSPEIPGPWGQCFNNQLEYLDHYEHSMETSFADLGLIIKRYGFFTPGSLPAPRGTYIQASAGQAYNITATIPGADHPEETVLVGAHYDFTDSGPAAAWDSQEGHTEIMRMAYIMADYYRKTNTRPAVTLKFVPWDAEESGTFGSQDYVDNNIPPGEFDEVRGYFNVDPCAGAYPAFGEGPDADRQIQEVLQLANPANFEDEPEIKARIESWNDKALTVIDQVLEHLDDRLTRPGGVEVPIFVSNAEAAAGSDSLGSLGGAPSDRPKIATAVGGLLLFGSDYSNFEEVGIPIFNLFPDMFGPHADETPSDGGAKGLEILHTNNDHLLRINRLTSGMSGPLLDPTGTFASEGWAKGMEFCAQVEAWGMLQPEMAGAQTVDTAPVAYYEALPNEAIIDQDVTFDATGTYQYANAASRTMEPESALSYEWDFGDGTKGSGKTIQHSYGAIGRYTTKLTVTGAGGQTDTMSIPVEVIGSNFVGPILAAIPPADAEDGNFPLSWTFTGTRAGFETFGVEESKDYRSLFLDPAEDIAQNWNVEPPTKPGIQPWQHSDSGTQKFRGNAFRSPPRSFWTGVSPNSFGGIGEGTGPEPVNGQSILTLKTPIQVPAEGDPELTYSSLFQNETNDRGLVQIALTTGSTPADQLDWETVDQVSGVCGNNPNQLSAPLVPRKVDLGKYKGKQILVRFVYNRLEGGQINVFPCGWYVDDIGVFHGTWDQIGTSNETNFVVTSRPNGSYGYRVKAIYRDGVKTGASNVEAAVVKDSKALPNPELERCLKAGGNPIIGTAGKDKLIGTAAKDVLCGFAGKDRFNGKGGNDVIFAGGGKDTARGGGGNDLIRGEKGKDTLSGGKGNDRLKGGKKADILKGGPGKDKCGNKSEDTRLKC